MGAEKDIIVAVELGSTAIRGIAGKREPDGTMRILAIAQEETKDCIRKGLVDNIDKTTQAISHVVKKINEELGISTKRVFMGLSGQSLRTLENKVPYQFAEKTLIDNKLIDQLKEINNGIVYPQAKIHDVIPQEYRIGNRFIQDPVGMQSEQIEARFVNVVARNGMSENIERCVRNAGLEVADLFISPICLADSLLSANEKRSGCALVDIGADTTTISVYYSNLLRHLVVIPLGGNNVTTDISTKSIELGEAEELKLKYGTAWHESEEEPNKNKIQISFDRTITEGELNNITEARYEEIIVNIWAHIEPYKDKLLSGILLTGGASKAKNLAKAITEYTQTDKQIRFAKGLPLNIKLASNIHVPEDSNLNTLMALLLKGDQNCVGEAPEITEVSPVEAEEPAVGISTKEDEPAVVDSSANLQDENAEEEKKPKKDGNVKKKIHNVFSVIKKMLTDPEEEDEEITDEN
ncbi:MAG: cell division protein FtsA [Bacteroidaceae bacterium]|nr:cell division protein FtsA [Bacteroidaceae bacterium]MBR6169720.1 cell division protein FtsA [Bacteroidaceae bacterium]